MHAHGVAFQLSGWALTCCKGLLHSATEAQHYVPQHPSLWPHSPASLLLLTTFVGHAGAPGAIGQAVCLSENNQSCELNRRREYARKEPITIITITGGGIPRVVCILQRLFDVTFGRIGWGPSPHSKVERACRRQSCINQHQNNT